MVGGLSPFIYKLSDSVSEGYVVSSDRKKTYKDFYGNDQEKP